VIVDDVLLAHACTYEYAVKDVVGPKGSVSIVSSIEDSSDIQSHSLAEALLVHPNGLGACELQPSSSFFLTV
jgi:hypothetical protein